MDAVSLQEIIISDTQKKGFHKDLASMENTLDNVPDFIKISKIITQKNIGDLLRNSFYEIKHNNGFIVIRNLPVDDDLPPTPKDGQRPKEKYTTSEAVLLGVVSCLGYNPFSFVQEKEGAIVHEIAPMSALSKSVSSSGVVDFDYHTDGAYLDRYIRPHVLALSCLRNDSNTCTKICRLGSLIQRLDECDLIELMQSNYIHSPPESFMDNKKIKAPILNRVDDRFEITVSTHNVKPLTDKAGAALCRLRYLAKSNYTEVSWRPGDMVIFNNLRCMHARGEIRGDRWLQRCYGSERSEIPLKVDLKGDISHAVNPKEYA